MFRVIVCWFVVLLSAASASADLLPDAGQVVSHNGSLSSVPPGTGDVNVLFDHGSLTFGTYQGDFFEIASHQVEYLYTPGAEQTLIFAKSFITNQTAVPWSGFRIELGGADFTGYTFSPFFLAPDENPVEDIGFDPTDVANLAPDLIGLQHWGPDVDQFTLLGSSITRSNDPGAGFLDAELIVNFDDPLLPGKSFWLHYNIVPPAGNPTATGFTARFTPIPEPSTIVLFGLGAFAGLRRGKFLGIV